MKTVFIAFLLSLPFHLFAQEFWTGTKNTTSSISRDGTTSFGYMQIRTSTPLYATIIEHTFTSGDLYIRSTLAGTTNTGNLILNDGNGKVGIGTASPQAKLSVNGNILAKEIKIKTDISVPDYVFKADYKLPSLEEIAEYINRNGHLPEVQSAVEVKQDGLDLAAMNLLLLKKVEELTLHLIAKEKDIKTIQESYDGILVRLMALENKL
ncbi:hypothetical protein SAMN05216436_12115 [bacterium A37T11]|nr:hypothetical protein SAMN05216436_12115 [bacterium A37T11]